MKVKFTPSARTQFLDGLEYIRQDSPTAARKFRKNAESVLRRLEKFPESGRSIPRFPGLPHFDPFYFEKVILMLLKRMGYGDFTETAKSGDAGIDGIINEDKLGLEKIYIQAKRYTDNKVRETDIRNFIGAMSGDTTKGVFVTTSRFDEKATKKAREAHHTIILVDGERLVDLMYQFNVGVQVRNQYEVKQIDSDFFDAS